MNTESKNKLRLIYLAKVLFEQTDEDHVLNSVELMQILLDEYGISTHRQTLAADIELLVEFGMDIETIKSNPNKYHLASREFGLTEIKLLIDAVASGKFIPAGKSKALIDKLGLLAGKKQAAKLKRNIEVEGRVRADQDKISFIVDAVNTAINEGKKISFLYLQYDGQKEKHITNNGNAIIFSPHRLVWNGDHFYMLGWSEEPEGVAAFRIDRIFEEPVVLEEKAHKMPKDFKKSSYLNMAFHSLQSEAQEVELEGDMDTLDAITDKFGDKIPLDFGSKTYHTSISTAVDQNFYGWLFSFGGKVRIVSPESAVREYGELVEKAYKETKAASPSRKTNSFFWWLN